MKVNGDDPRRGCDHDLGPYYHHHERNSGGGDRGHIHHVDTVDMLDVRDPNPGPLADLGGVESPEHTVLRLILQIQSQTEPRTWPASLFPKSVWPCA